MVAADRHFHLVRLFRQGDTLASPATEGHLVVRRRVGRHVVDDPRNSEPLVFPPRLARHIIPRTVLQRCGVHTGGRINHCRHGAIDAAVRTSLHCQFEICQVNLHRLLCFHLLDAPFDRESRSLVKRGHCRPVYGRSNELSFCLRSFPFIIISIHDQTAAQHTSLGSPCRPCDLPHRVTKPLRYHCVDRK